MPNSVLRVEGLKVWFGNARILEGVGLEVEKGKVVGLVGPNGSGKTTTLRAISGAIKRTAGTVSLDGIELPNRPESVASKRVIHVPENRGLMTSLTARQNLKLGAIAVGAPYSADTVRDAIKIFPALEPILDRRAGLLSGGQQQMVAISRGLIAQPEFLMVDELSLGLAPKVVSDVLHGLLTVAKERHIGLLLVDQNVRALARVCDTVYILSDGKTVLAGSGDDQLFNAVYLGEDGPPAA